MAEVYFSIDIETDGAAPGVNSMLSVGIQSYIPVGRNGEYLESASFYNTLLPLEDAFQNQETMAWWRTQPEAWEEVNKDRRHPSESMADLAIWIDEIRDHGKAIAVAWPAAFDFGFVNYYLHRFAGHNPLGFACLDIRSYANGLFDVPGYYERIPEGDLYTKFDIDLSDIRPHFAIDDAKRQGRLFMALRNCAIINR